MFQFLVVGYVCVVLALFAVSFTVPRLRWPALTLATLATVIPILLGAVWLVLMVITFGNGAHIG
jgi:hypothetical protein